MIKRVVLMLLIGAIFAMTSFAGKDYYTASNKTLTITGVGSGDDSTVVDSYPIFNTMHYGNRYWITVKFDSVEKHEPSGFGLRDSIFVVIFTEFEGQRIVLDSTEDTLKDDTELTLNFTGSGAGDSIQSYGEHLWVWVRIADTVGATTDSVHNFNFEISAIHLYTD